MKNFNLIILQSSLTPIDFEHYYSKYESLAYGVLFFWLIVLFVSFAKYYSGTREGINRFLISNLILGVLTLAMTIPLLFYSDKVIPFFINPHQGQFSLENDLGFFLVGYYAVYFFIAFFFLHLSTDKPQNIKKQHKSPDFGDFSSKSEPS